MNKRSKSLNYNSISSATIKITKTLQIKLKTALLIA